MSLPDSDSADLCSLPVELIFNIATWAQKFWLAEICGGHAVTHVSRMLPPTMNQDDCRGVTAGVVPECLADVLLQLPAPAHALIHTCSRLRTVLLHHKELWRYTNTLFHVLAQRAGPRSIPPSSLQAVGAQFAYASDILVADRACSCLVSGIARFYATLRVVKVSLPWADFAEDGHVSIAHFFYNHHCEDTSPLQYFDLQLHEDPTAPPGFLVARQSPALVSCRITNAEFFFYGQCLELLSVTFPPGTQHCFGPSLLNALNGCPNLQSFTFIGAECQLIDTVLGHPFDDELPETIQMPSLLYIRLQLPASVIRAMLGRMVLPAGIDIHLEPTCHMGFNNLTSENELPITLSSPGETGEANPLWRYVAALVAPAQAPAAFRNPSDFVMPQGGQEGEIIQGVSAIALDIRYNTLESSPSPGVSLASNATSFVFAASVQGSVTLPSLNDNTGVRRSITIRDIRLHFSDFNIDRAVSNLLRTVIAGQTHTPFTGLGNIQSLVFHAESWLPTSGDGWRLFFAPLQLAELIILCEQEFTTRPSVDALVHCLSTHTLPWAAPSLRLIRITRYMPVQQHSGSLKQAFEVATNPPGRLASGASVIEWQLGQ